jgi:hypothetical protein
MKIEEVREIACQHQINPEALSQVDLIRSIQGIRVTSTVYGMSYVLECCQYEYCWRMDCQIAVQSNPI